MLLLLLITFTYLNVFPQDAITKIIIVRHAEKENDGTKNPHLSEIGKKRAKKLNTLFAEEKIDRLYSTPYLRTIETLQPLSISKKLDIINYNPNDVNFAQNLILNEKGKTIIIAGHSNTSPNLVNTLINESKYQDLDETDYDKIWIITFKNEEKTDCILLNY